MPLDTGWHWDWFRGSPSALKWNRKDLPSVERVVRFVPQRRVVVQAGGNLGIFPKALSKVFEQVITFEPTPDLFAMLMHNAPEPNIVKLQAAVGDTARLVGMSRVRRDSKPDPHEGITHVAGEGSLPMLPIDALRLPVCDLMYLDVEGYELFALWGAIETVHRCKPVLAVEINRGITYEGYTRADVEQWILDQGYRHVLTVQSDEVFVPVEATA